MNQPDDDRNTLPSPAQFSLASAISQAFITPPLRSLVRALQLGAEERWELTLADVERVEAVWEMLDGFSISHGFVLSLTGSRRAYLQYVSDEDAEEVEILPMADERFPILNSGGFAWTDDVGDLNRFLKP